MHGVLQGLLLGSARVWGLCLAAVIAGALLVGCGAKTGLGIGPGLDPVEDAGTGGTGGMPAFDAGVQARADKIDLLFMIDGSGSMTDKQQILAVAVPDLVHRLNNPLCLGANGAPASRQPASPLLPCPSGSEREFNSVQDMHIGVISSNLGSHGADGGCGAAGNSDDRAHLLRRGAADATYQDLGFLAWDPGRTKRPPGETDAAALGEALRRMVLGVGEAGCAAESSLEAWYRFLIDPEPYERFEVSSCDSDPRGCGVARGLDEELLQQRRDFLRPDSLVAIVMLTDENDCSLLDDTTSFNMLSSNPMPRATSECKRDPLDRCCRSCAATDPIAGCPDPASDPECQQGPYRQSDDSRYLRCFDQKRRFGQSFLQPVQRYVDGLTQLAVPRRDGVLVDNPLFVAAPGAAPRHPSLVFVAGIVGVPWQDLARDPNDFERLNYKSARELHDQKVWDVIVGDPANGVLPTDPLMIESVLPRTGKNPVTGSAIAPPEASSPRQNPINGHEMLLDYAGFDLQYACIFELPEPRDCNSAGFNCDCGPNASGSFKPICQDENGAYGATQFRAKAFPGLRQLEVLKGFGENAIVGSICARNATDPTRQDYGYRPALRAILERLSAGLL